MTTVNAASVSAGGAEATEGAAAARRGRTPLLFEIDGLVGRPPLADAAAIAKLNPHRHEMALLDEIVWADEAPTMALALFRVRSDQFWVRGHFPSRPTLPGVLMIECGAQLACWLWNTRSGVSRVAAFLRIEDAVFRRAVVPGDDMYILCREAKYSARRFISDIQGVVNGELTFNARITGMAMELHDGT